MGVRNDIIAVFRNWTCCFHDLSNIIIIMIRIRISTMNCTLSSRHCTNLYIYFILSLQRRALRLRVVTLSKVTQPVTGFGS